MLRLFIALRRSLRAHSISRCPGDRPFRARNLFRRARNLYDQHFRYAGRPDAAIVAADFNGDGNTDLATLLTVLPGKGDGTFGTPIPHGMPGSLNAVIGGDFNEDGIADILITSNAGPDIYPGRGDGSFGKPVTDVGGVNPITAYFSTFRR